VAIDIPATPKLSQIGWATEAKMGTPDDFLEFGAASSDANDNVVFVGSFAGKLTVDAAVLTSSNGSTKDKSDIFVVRLSPDGKSTGSKRLGGATEDRGRHVVALPGGRAIVGGVVGGSGYVAAITF
jgi:hypothetical protein